MELLYEDFIFNFTVEKYSDKFKEITKQKSNLYLADTYVNGKVEGKSFNLKQDIYLRDSKDNIYILDTKYKMLNGNKCDKYGIKQADMYQMSSYALRGGYKNLVLSYPETCELNDDIRFGINSGFGDVRIGIDILQVSFMLDYECFKNGEKFESLCSINDERLMRNLEGGLLCKEIM